MTNILIIGATGSIGQVTREYLLQNPDDQLTLMARHTSRLQPINPARERVIEGSVTDQASLQHALVGQDVVFAALSGDLPQMAKALVAGLKAAGVDRLLFISSMGIYNEIPANIGSSGNLNQNPVLAPYRQAADIIEASNLNYTVIRPGWFDNGSTDYQVTHKGEPFGGHDVARASIADLVMRLAHDANFGRRDSLGINRKQGEKMKLLILAANGQIAQIVEQRVLTEPQFAEVQLTLGLRRAQRLADLATNDRVQLREVDLENPQSVDAAMANQDMVFVAVVDHDGDNAMTKNVIAAMKAHHVDRIVFTNILGLYNEVPGEFGRWNLSQVASGLKAAQTSDQLLAESGLTYTTLRLPWLNDRDEVNYTITTRHEPYLGVSGSRQSVADVVLKIVADPTVAANDSIGIADPATQGQTRPVY